MEKNMIVHRLEDDGTAILCPETRSCGGNCETCPDHGRQERLRRFRAYNPVGAQVGDRVTATVKRSSVAMTAVRMYVMPVLLFLACYILGEKLWGQGPFTGMGGLVLALVLGTIYDRFIYRKKVKFTITGIRKKESC